MNLSDVVRYKINLNIICTPLVNVIQILRNSDLLYNIIPNFTYDLATSWNETQIN